MARALPSTDLVLSRFTDVDRIPRNESLDSNYLSEDLCSLDNALKDLVSTISQLGNYIKSSKGECCKTGEYGVTNEESAAIYLYTTEWHNGEKSLYQYVNKAARENKRAQLRPWNRYLRLLVSGLEKFPSIKTVVWRGFQHDATNDYTGTKTFVWRSVSSCSRDPQRVIDNGFLGVECKGTLFCITAKHGKDIKAFSKYKNEQEVVFLPNTKFRMTREAKKENIGTLKDVSVIYLEEI